MLIYFFKWLHFKIETYLVHHTEDFEYNEVLRAERDLQIVKQKTLHRLANELLDLNVRLEKQIKKANNLLYKKGEMNDEQNTENRVCH